MGNMWVTDIRHLLDEKGDLPDDLPSPANHLARHLTDIVAAVTCQDFQHDVIPTPVECRRRPARKKCTGHIHALIQKDLSIRWQCDFCGDAGYIQGWRGTKWDHTLD